MYICEFLATTPAKKIFVVRSISRSVVSRSVALVVHKLGIQPQSISRFVVSCSVVSCLVGCCLVVSHSVVSHSVVASPSPLRQNQRGKELAELGCTLFQIADRYLADLDFCSKVALQ